MSEKLVSICMITYNHEAFLQKAIEGVLMQKAAFSYELIIGEDCSIDQTRKICEEHAQKHPKVIKLLSNEKNLGIIPNLIRTLKACSGKYIALCEGDDYWTDPLKLQKQVEFLEKHPECNYVFTNNKILKKDSNLADSQLNSIRIDEIVDLNFLLEKNIMPPTQTVMFRRSALPATWPEFFFINGDWALLFLLTHNSKIGYLNECTAVYREGVGIISSVDKVTRFRSGMELNDFLNKHTNLKYDYFLGDNQYHLENLTYAHLEKKNYIVSAYCFFFKLLHSQARYGIKVFWNRNFSFAKHSIKMLLRKN